MTTPIASLPEIASNQANKHLTHNTALRYLEGLMFRANSATTSAEPVSPLGGDVYIMPASPSGTNWAAFSEHDVTILVDSVWVQFTPWEGLSLWVSDLNKHMTFNGGTWQLSYREIINVEDRNLATLPTSPIPTAGQAYIVASGSPQQFSPDQIAIADGTGGWFTYAPEEGDVVYIKDEQVFSSFNTGSPLGWSAGSSI